ncbi:MAG: hypothetical protein JWN34_3268 [Bryobacterales bacterium]|nr:hypothetical protein [Bryobacterales bacterium]
MLKVVTTLLCGAIFARAADGIHVQRDGGFWLVHVSGTASASSVARISAEGDLTVRGKATSTLRYIVSARVNAGTELEARQFAKGLATIRLSGDTIVFHGPGTVSVELPHNIRLLTLASEDGSIDAADMDGSVNAQTVAGRISLDRIAGDVELRSNGGPTSLGRIEGNVNCFSGGGSIRAIRIRGKSSFETNGGDIVLGEVFGPVRAITRGGGIQIDHAGSQVFAGTTGGPITVVRAMGAVAAQSYAGPIHIGTAPSVECQTGGGTIRLDSVTGALRAITERGNVIVGIIDGQLQNSFLSTAAGDILVVLPSNMGVTVEAEVFGTHTQGIVSGYPGLESLVGRSSVTAHGAINGGGAKLRLRAAGGRIEIRRK